MDLIDLLAAGQFDHEWLSETFVEESQLLAASEAAWRHHFVPEFYLRRWCVSGLLKPVIVDSNTTLDPRAPRRVAFERDLYTIPVGNDTQGQSSRWVETHLARIENKCSAHISALLEGSIGPVGNHGVRRDLSVFLGLQISRTAASRRRAMAITTAPDSAKRKLLIQLAPSASLAEIEQSMQDQLADRKHGAIRMIVEEVRNILAASVLSRHWAVYETLSPVFTNDEPVMMIAGPGYARSSFVGTGLSAALVYPLSPDRILVMLRADLRHSRNFVLNEEETCSVNREILATADEVAFARPADSIADSLSVPSRPVFIVPDYEHLSDEDVIALMLKTATPSSRWSGASELPPWPVQRWYDR